jgi:hypothetical protein
MFIGLMFRLFCFTVIGIHMFVFAVDIVFVQFGWYLKLIKRGSTLNLE